MRRQPMQILGRLATRWRRPAGVRRPAAERGFSLLEIMISIGILTTITVLTWASLQATQVTSAIMIFTAAAAVKIASLPGSRAKI